MTDETMLEEGLPKTLDDPAWEGYGEAQKGKVCAQRRWTQWASF